MSVSRIWIAGYRSLLNIDLPLSRLNVVTGANGVGKSNLYRALSLIARAADGGFGRAIAEEGGMPSVLWAGPRRAKSPVRVELGFQTDGFGFHLAAGLRPPAPGDAGSSSAFNLDPQVKQEFLWYGTASQAQHNLAQTDQCDC